MKRFFGSDKASAAANIPSPPVSSGHTAGNGAGSGGSGNGSGGAGVSSGASANGHGSKLSLASGAGSSNSGGGGAAGSGISHAGGASGRVSPSVAMFSRALASPYAHAHAQHGADASGVSSAAGASGLAAEPQYFDRPFAAATAAGQGGARSRASSAAHLPLPQAGLASAGSSAFLPTTPGIGGHPMTPGGGGGSSIGGAPVLLSGPPSPAYAASTPGGEALLVHSGVSGASASASGQGIIPFDRNDLHKSLKALENLLVSLDEYRDLAAKMAKTEKRLAKAASDLAKAKATRDVPAQTLSVSAALLEAQNDVAGRHAKYVQREYEALNESCAKYFKRVAKEEKAYTESIDALDAKVKKAHAAHEKNASKNKAGPKAIESHDKYIASVSALTAEIAGVKERHALSLGAKGGAIQLAVAACVGGMADAEFRAHCERVRKTGPYVGKVNEWLNFASSEAMPALQPLGLLDDGADEPLGPAAALAAAQAQAELAAAQRRAVEEAAKETAQLEWAARQLGWVPPEELQRVQDASTNALAVHMQAQAQALQMQQAQHQQQQQAAKGAEQATGLRSVAPSISNGGASRSASTASRQLDLLPRLDSNGQIVEEDAGSAAKDTSAAAASVSEAADEQKHSRGQNSSVAEGTVIESKPALQEAAPASGPPSLTDSSGNSRAGGSSEEARAAGSGMPRTPTAPAEDPLAAAAAAVPAGTAARSGKSGTSGGMLGRFGFERSSAEGSPVKLSAAPQPVPPPVPVVNAAAAARASEAASSAVDRASVAAPSESGTETPDAAAMAAASAARAPQYSESEYEQQHPSLGRVDSLALHQSKAGVPEPAESQPPMSIWERERARATSGTAPDYPSGTNGTRSGIRSPPLQQQGQAPYRSSYEAGREYTAGDRSTSYGRAPPEEDPYSPNPSHDRNTSTASERDFLARMKAKYHAEKHGAPAAADPYRRDEYYRGEAADRPVSYGSAAPPPSGRPSSFGPRYAEPPARHSYDQHDSYASRPGAGEDYHRYSATHSSRGPVPPPQRQYDSLPAASGSPVRASGSRASPVPPMSEFGSMRPDARGGRDAPYGTSRSAAAGAYSHSHSHGHADDEPPHSEVCGCAKCSARNYGAGTGLGKSADTRRFAAPPPPSSMRGPPPPSDDYYSGRDREAGPPGPKRQSLPPPPSRSAGAGPDAYGSLQNRGAPSAYDRNSGYRPRVSYDEDRRVAFVSETETIR